MKRPSDELYFFFIVLLGLLVLLAMNRESASLRPRITQEEYLR